LCTGMALASEHDPRIDPFQWHCQWMCILTWRHDKIYTPNNCSLEQRLWVMVFGLFITVKGFSVHVSLYCTIWFL
jgi:hypothetical protein